MATRTQLSDEENTRVQTKLIELKKHLGSWRAVGLALGYPIGTAQQTISKAASDRAGAGVARALDDYLAKHSPAHPTNDQPLVDPAAGSFLMALDRLPGLRRWVEVNPTRLTVSQLVRGIVTYDTSPPRSREDGQPFGGWDAFFDDVLSNRLSGPKKRGDQAAAEALELSQMSPGTRKRLKR